MTLDLQKSVAPFRYTQGALKPGTQDRYLFTYEPYLRSRVKIKGYVAAEAQLSIGKKSNATLTALLERLPRLEQGNIDGLRMVANELSFSSSSSSCSPGGGGRESSDAWKDMMPALKESVLYEQKSKFFMFAKFKNRKIWLPATAQGFGAALMLGRKSDSESNVSSSGENSAKGSRFGVEGLKFEAEESKFNGQVLKSDVEGSKVSVSIKSVDRRYIFFLEVQDLNRLWIETQDEISAQQFDISRVLMQVIEYRTTLKQLREDVALGAIGAGESSTDFIKPLDGAGTDNQVALDSLTAISAKTTLELFSGMDERMEFKPGV